MQHKLIIRLALAAGLGVTAWNVAADPGADQQPPAAEQPQGHPGGPGFGPGPGFGRDGDHEHGPGPERGPEHGFDHGPGHEGGPMGGPVGETLQTLREIEHLYREQGKTREVIALYQEVLGKTKDPLVRHFAYEAIAHAQAQPVDTDKAIATLRQSLDESLQHLNQMPQPPHEGKAAQ